ncbi:MAG TPA: hypothetical protein VHF07_05085 [Nitrospiraceae bacterium]|nr:hypothetical protein [Nitrospiraceae bacterium]
MRADLLRTVPQLYDLEPGGALALDLERDGWLLEITPDGRLMCQHGIAMDDIKSLMSDGTTEDLGTDEVAKQAKYFLQPAVAKFRPAFTKAGFDEHTEMNDEYVAIQFEKAVDWQRLDELQHLVRWCQEQIR